MKELLRGRQSRHKGIFEKGEIKLIYLCIIKIYNILMELWSIRAWRNLKVKIVLSPQGDKIQEVFSQSNKASTAPEWKPKFLNSKTSTPVITPEWPDLVISLQKGNRPSLFFNKSELQYLDTRQHCLEITDKGSVGTSWVAVFSYRSFQNSSGIQ